MEANNGSGVNENKIPESILPQRFELVNADSRCSLDDDIVISGLSGRFPESRNVEEFKQNLFKGVDLITEDDRKRAVDTPGIPSRMGKISGLEFFDAGFFRIHAKQAAAMDPQSRVLLEHTYEAIIDSGTNPVDVRGSRTGVFIGVNVNESYYKWFPDLESGVNNQYGLLGCNRAMFANRISYTFDFKGPSFALDTASSSSMYALQQAHFAMRHGLCDAAIVGGTNIIMDPVTSLHLAKLNMLSSDGKSKTFDISGDGYARSEAAVVVYLQRVSKAKRVYATIVNSGVNADGAKEEGITYPSGSMQTKLMKETFAEVNLDPREVAYVEAHGTGTPAGDLQEAKSIADVFCNERNAPLLVGSHKSNMGHSEAASGLCGVSKAIICMESGLIPPTLHHRRPNPKVSGFSNGKLKVVDTVTRLDGDLVAVNSFRMGGTNAHTIFRSNPKNKSIVTENEAIPRIIGVSGRTNDAVDFMIKEIEKHPKDSDLCGLIHEIHKRAIRGHNYRGYSVFGASLSKKEIVTCTAQDRPVWFVFSGIGSQWPGMVKTLMDLRVFSESITKCAKALEPHDLDLISILTSEDVSTFKNILHCFVSIVAMHIALVDVLTAVGISPDGIIGHSVGEIGCAYADGAFTADQAILAAYWRGRAVLDSELPLGAMATVGLSVKEFQTRAPSDVTVACHNSADNVTISGSPNSVSALVSTLHSEGILEVDSSGVAFHSRFIADAAKKFLKHLKEVIPDPQPRTPRWISSSIPKSAWSSILARKSSAEYHVNNFVSPVLFTEAVSHIPQNSIIIEIAPHSLLQAILKRSLSPSCINIGLLKRGSVNNIIDLLSNLGKLYNAGIDPDFSALYPPVKFPVPRGTPMIQSLIKWDHSTEWAVVSMKEMGFKEKGILTKIIDLQNEGDSYRSGHTINGETIFPLSGYIVLLWQALASQSKKNMEELPIVIEDIQVHRHTLLPKSDSVQFEINILKGSGAFVFVEGGVVVASGRSNLFHVAEELQVLSETENVGTEILTRGKADIYRDLQLQDYDHTSIFQGTHEADFKGSKGELLWAGNWVTYLDSIMQFCITEMDPLELCLPTKIQKISINPQAHFNHLKSMPFGTEKTMSVFKYGDIGILRSGGVEIVNLKTETAPRKEHGPEVDGEDQTKVEDGKSSNNKQSTLADSVAEILGIKDASAVDPSSSLVDLGMDSILGNEIGALMNGNFGMKLSSKDIRCLNFGKLLDL